MIEHDKNKLDELLEIIDGQGIDVPEAQLIADVERRVQSADQALADCRAVLVATQDPSFQPDGWRMNVGEAVRDTVAQRERLLAYKAQLQEQLEARSVPAVDLQEAEGPSATQSFGVPE